ncbi:MAG TPA: maleylpyruvate isomerase family mycothiol-dependent enzyme [Mycobacteriales bacterium]|nr:maleylpyruvate isomerase family mycothiol-dependent enzyme [Mycobacteriales bacterium]
MDTDAIYAAAAVNRRAMADLLEALTPEQLSAPSLCGAWDVQTVGAHLAAAITTRTSAFVLEVIRNKGSFDRANAATAIKEARNGVPATIAKIRANADSRFTPPVTGPRAPLTDVIVHTGDIARPLGLPHDAPADQIRTALEFLTGGRPVAFTSAKILAGLRFEADDLGMTMGDGVEVHGRGIDIVMAMCGRAQALSALDGAGVEVLRSRFR